MRNRSAANIFEGNLLKAVMAANSAELHELEKYMPALVSAERARREEEYYSGGNGTAYRPGEKE